MNRFYMKWLLVATVGAIAILLLNVVVMPRAISLSLQPAATAGVSPQQGNEPIELHEFAFVELAGRVGHEGYFPIQGEPVPGKEYTVRVKLFGPVQNASVDLVSANGNVLANVPLSREYSWTFDGTVIVPNQPFRVRAKGLDSSGHSFMVDQVTTKPAVTPQTLEIVLFPIFPVLAPGTPARFFVRLVNFGLPDTFNLSASDTPSSFLVPSSTSVFLASQQSTTTEIATVVPQNSDPLASFILKVEVSGSSTQARNSASLDLLLESHPGQPLVVRVKPGSCVSPINSRARGTVPVAIMATPQFDPPTINQRDIYLLGNVAPTRISVEDVGSPRLEDCGSTAPDGRKDLLLFFESEKIVAAINNLLKPGAASGQKPNRTDISIPLSARTNDGVLALGFGVIQFQN